VAIEIRHTKRAIVYRAVVRSGSSARTVTKTFRTKAAAEAWEREMLLAAEGRARPRSEPSDAST
jgi:hypothetical protein